MRAWRASRLLGATIGAVLLGATIGAVMITRRGMLADAFGLTALSVSAAFRKLQRLTAQPVVGVQPWTSNATARSPPSKGPAEYFTGTVRIDPLFQAPAPARGARRQCHLRAGRTNRLAHPSARPNPDCHRGLRPGAARGRAGRGNPPGRRGLVCAWRKTLAWRRADDGDDAYRHRRKRKTAKSSTGWRRSVTSNTAVERSIGKSGTENADNR